MQGNNMVTVNFMFCNRNEPKQCINTRQIAEVSNSTRQRAEIMQTYEKLAI